MYYLYSFNESNLYDDHKVVYDLSVVSMKSKSKRSVHEQKDKAKEIEEDSFSCFDDHETPILFLKLY